MNQRRFIEKQNKWTGIEIDEIKERVGSELNVQNSQTDTEADDVAVEETKVDEVEPSQNPSVIEDLAKEIRRARAEWENTSITERPPLPLTVNRKAELLIKQANQAIQLEIAEETPDLNNINLLQSYMSNTPELSRIVWDTQRSDSQEVRSRET